MGCGSSTGADGKIRMKRTKLPGMDDIFDDAQKLIDEIYEIQDPIDHALDNLLYHTGFYKTPCATAHHAMVGIVFAMASKSKGEGVDDMFKILPQSPFITFDKTKANGDTARAIDDLTDYIQALTAANDRIGPMTEKAKSFAEKAPDMPEKAKDDLDKTDGLGAMDKMKAVKNSASNAKNMAKLPQLVADFKDTVQEALESVQGGTKELNAKKGDLSDIGKKCSEKGWESAKDCYLECGDEIEVTKEGEKKFAARQKKKKMRKTTGKK